jgi:hypothetical protein
MEVGVIAASGQRVIGVDGAGARRAHRGAVSRERHDWSMTRSCDAAALKSRMRRAGRENCRSATSESATGRAGEDLEAPRNGCRRTPGSTYDLSSNVGRLTQPVTQRQRVHWISCLQAQCRLNGPPCPRTSLSSYGTLSLSRRSHLYLGIVQSTCPVESLSTIQTRSPGSGFFSWYRWSGRAPLERESIASFTSTPKSRPQCRCCSASQRRAPPLLTLEPMSACSAWGVRTTIRITGKLCGQRYVVPLARAIV